MATTDATMLASTPFRGFYGQTARIIYHETRNILLWIFKLIIVVPLLSSGVVKNA
ncbi:predicted protein [Sclerotinia sclerotiorum 1980 UF-70]|uniref:Uncharacterized protein n=1 Tax=Sclerotinia sclerotiorum (strain ATCC 18683 / 1980 / Ss-1) TaxID=665079 RepID=A7E6S5_SCLS1|nr:predicted protein [Sclerotinia sclerotiorum 1980 UF-70]EDN91597.1 predicted protein [Sclerotinia sclerotiorum 1980 UF-70]